MTPDVDLHGDTTFRNGDQTQLENAERILLIRYQEICFEGVQQHMLTIRDLSKIRDLKQEKMQNQYLNMLNATVSHEVMSPLNCIQTFAKNLEQNLPKSTSRNQAQMIYYAAGLMKF